MNAAENTLRYLTKRQLMTVCQNGGLPYHSYEYEATIRERVRVALVAGEIPAHLIVAAWDGVERDIAEGCFTDEIRARSLRVVRVNGKII